MTKCPDHKSANSTISCSFCHHGDQRASGLLCMRCCTRHLPFCVSKICSETITFIAEPRRARQQRHSARLINTSLCILFWPALRPPAQAMSVVEGWGPNKNQPSHTHFDPRLCLIQQ